MKVTKRTAVLRLWKIQLSRISLLAYENIISTR